MAVTRTAQAGAWTETDPLTERGSVRSARPRRPVLLFVNPRARYGEAARLKAASLLEGAGFAVRPIECQYREDLAEQLRLLARRPTSSLSVAATAR